MKLGRSRNLPICPPLSTAAQEQDYCVSTIRQIDHVLAQAAETVTARRFQQMLLQSSRELFNNVLEQYELGDFESIQQLMKVLERWVSTYNAGGQVLVIMLLIQALSVSYKNIDRIDEFLQQAKYTVEAYAKRYLLGKILSVEGNIYFHIDADKAMQAYLECLEACQTNSIGLRDQNLVEQMKVCIVTCHYKLSLLQKKHPNTDKETVLSHLKDSTRSAVDLFGRDNTLTKRIEKVYNQQLEASKRPPSPKPKKPAIIAYNGQIILTEKSRNYSGDMLVSYDIQDRVLKVVIRSERQGKRAKIEVQYPIDIPENKVADLGETLSWMSVINYKILINDRQIQRITRGQPKTTRRSLWIVDKKDIFTEANPQVFNDSSSSQEDQEQDIGEQQEIEIPQSLPCSSQPLKQSKTYSKISRQSTRLQLH